jgi:hypothetical protein
LYLIVVCWCVTKKIKLELSSEELKALATLAENQFFRMKYIDPKMPGYTIAPETFRASQSAVALLSDAMKKERGFPVRPVEANPVKVMRSGLGS